MSGQQSSTPTTRRNSWPWPDHFDSKIKKMWAPLPFKPAIINKESNIANMRLEPEFPPLRDKRKGLLGFLPHNLYPLVSLRGEGSQVHLDRKGSNPSWEPKMISSSPPYSISKHANLNIRVPSAPTEGPLMRSLFCKHSFATPRPLVFVLVTCSQPQKCPNLAIKYIYNNQT